jgi:hypothetical protein
VRYVIVGPLLDARVWARNRTIGDGSAIFLYRADDTFRLRGLAGSEVVIVRLSAARADPQIEQALAVLRAGGAVVRRASWWPGRDPDEGTRVRLRAAEPW